jgi:hypothetical protein
MPVFYLNAIGYLPLLQTPVLERFRKGIRSMSILAIEQIRHLSNIATSILTHQNKASTRIKLNRRQCEQEAR